MSPHSETCYVEVLAEFFSPGEKAKFAQLEDAYPVWEKELDTLEMLKDIKPPEEKEQSPIEQMAVLRCKEDVEADVEFCWKTSALASERLGHPATPPILVGWISTSKVLKEESPTLVVGGIQFHAEDAGLSMTGLDILIWQRYSKTPWEEFVY